jgi:hypothetical protein
MYQVTGLTCSFVYSKGLQPAGINHLVTPIIYIFPRATHEPGAHNNGVGLCHKNVGCLWVTETRVIQYQPFALVNNARFHSECYTSDKGCNKTCEINIIPPTNKQYLKIHVRNWIRSQTSQRYTNRMKWTWGDKLQPIAVRTAQQHYTSRLTQLWLPFSYS